MTPFAAMAFLTRAPLVLAALAGIIAAIALPVSPPRRRCLLIGSAMLLLSETIWLLQAMYGWPLLTIPFWGQAAGLATLAAVATPSAKIGESGGQAGAPPAALACAEPTHDRHGDSGLLPRCVWFHSVSR